MLSDGDLARMRAVLTESLAGTAVIWTRTLTNEYGDRVMTYAAGGTVPARLSPLAYDERAVGDRIDPNADSLITIPGETAIGSNDRITMSGGTYNVTGVRDRLPWEISRRVEVQEIS